MNCCTVLAKRTPQPFFFSFLFSIILSIQFQRNIQFLGERESRHGFVRHSLGGAVNEVGGKGGKGGPIHKFNRLLEILVFFFPPSNMPPDGVNVIFEKSNLVCLPLRTTLDLTCEKFQVSYRQTHLFRLFELGGDRS